VYALRVSSHIRKTALSEKWPAEIKASPFSFRFTDYLSKWIACGKSFGIDISSRLEDYALDMDTRRWIVSFCCLLLGSSCVGTAPPSSKKDTRIIDSVPAPKDEAIRKITDFRHWLNPYIAIDLKGYYLILHDQPRTEVLLNLDQLETALLRLPLDHWPLGKVVAASENGTSVSTSDPQMVQNLTALRRMLKSHGVRVDLWPPA
jgi:hypothetical protein